MLIKSYDAAMEIKISQGGTNPRSSERFAMTDFDAELGELAHLDSSVSNHY